MRVVILFALPFCFLLSAGCGTTAPTSSDIHSMLTAVYWSDLAEVKKLLASDPRLLNVKGLCGRTPLLYAVSGVSPTSDREAASELAMFLLSQGADVHVADRWGVSPLHYAAAYEHRKLVEALIRRGANVKATSNYGKTPFHYATSKEVMKLFIANGADVSAKDRWGRTALFDSSLERAAVLLKLGLDPNQRDDDGKTPLHEIGDVRFAELLISTPSVDVNARDIKGETPLYKACKFNNKQMIQLFLDKGANPNVANNQGFTVLHAVLVRMKGHEENEKLSTFHRELVALLLANGADCNAKTNAGRTPLQFSARNGDTQMAKLLLEKGAEINAKDQAGWTALDHAITYGKDETAQWLKTQGGVSDPMSATAIEAFTAMEQGDFDKAKELVLQTPALARVRLLDGNTLLHNAVTAGAADIVDLLIQHGANINAAADAADTNIYADLTDGDCVDAMTPLGLAVEEGHVQIVKTLLNNGADLEPNGVSRCGLLVQASSLGHIEIAKELLAKGADVNARGIFENTPLHEAASPGRQPLFSPAEPYLALADLLLKNGADINARNWEDETPLIYALSNGHLETAALLVKNGADVNTCTYSYKTALWYAASYGNIDMVKRLLENGADPNIRDREGDTSLSLALQGGGEDLLNLLRKHGAME